MGSAKTNPACWAAAQPVAVRGDGAATGLALLPIAVRTILPETLEATMSLGSTSLWER